MVHSATTSSRLVPTRIEVQHLGNTKIISVACGFSTHSLGDGEGGAVDLGPRRNWPAGAQQQGAKVAPDTDGQGDVWQISCRDGVMWRQAHAGADSRGRVELWLGILLPTGPW